MLNMVTGPAECPNCGYPGATVLRESTWGGSAITLHLQCEECGKKYTAPKAVESIPKPVGALRYEKPMCCGRAMPVYNTKRLEGGLTMRFHKCKACGKTEKSAA